MKIRLSNKKVTARENVNQAFHNVSDFQMKMLFEREVQPEQTLTTIRIVSPISPTAVLAYNIFIRDMNNNGIRPSNDNLCTHFHRDF